MLLAIPAARAILAPAVPLAQARAMAGSSQPGTRPSPTSIRPHDSETEGVFTMTTSIKITIASAVVLGAATASLAGSPDGAQAFWSSMWTAPKAETRPTPVQPYALTGAPQRTNEPHGWTTSTENYGKSGPTVVYRR
jgi:hypothetical protein